MKWLFIIALTFPLTLPFTVWSKSPEHASWTKLSLAAKSAAASGLSELISKEGTALSEIQSYLHAHPMHLTDLDNDGRSALLVSLRSKRFDIFNFLYNYFGNPDPNTIDRSNFSHSKPLTVYQEALMVADWATVNNLKSRGGKATSLADQKTTELILAASFNSAEVIDHLLDAGEDVNATDSDGFTALIHAAQENQVEVVQLLLKRGADVHAKTNDDYTALLRASCNPGVVSTLIRAGSDLSVADITGKSALHVLAACDDDQDFDQVLAALKNVDFANTDGATPLTLAALSGSLKVARKLVNHQANVNYRSNSGMTPLMIVAKDGKNLDGLKFLIEAGADLNLISNERLLKQTALMYAAGANSDSEFTRMLLRAGADPNIQESEMGWTALMMAAIDQLEDNVIALVEGGANIHLVTHWGLQAYDYAEGAKMSKKTLNMLR